jgi:hypothetical protein
MFLTELLKIFQKACFINISGLRHLHCRPGPLNLAKRIFNSWSLF